MDLATFLSLIYAEHIRRNWGGSPPPFESDEKWLSVVADANRFWQEVGQFGEPPLVTGLSNPWIRDIYAVGYVVGPGDILGKLRVLEDGKIVVRTQSGVEIGLLDLQTNPTDALAAAKMLTYMAIFGVEPSAEEAQEINFGKRLSQKAGTLTLPTFPEEGIEVGEERFLTPLQEDRIRVVNRVLGGGAYTDRTAAESAWNAWVMEARAEGVDAGTLEQLTFSGIWDAYRGDYFNRAIPLGMGFSEYVDSYVGKEFARVHNEAFRQDQAAKARQHLHLTEKMTLPSDVAALIALGIPIGDALRISRPYPGEDYGSYRARIADSGILEQFRSILSGREEGRPAALISEVLGIDIPQGGFTEEQMADAAERAGLLVSPFQFEHATYQMAVQGGRGQGESIQSFDFLVPPAMAAEPYVSYDKTWLGRQLDTVKAGRGTEDVDEAILAFVRTLPPEEQMEAAQLLLAHRNEIQLELLLQAPALQTGLEEEAKRRAEDLEAGRAKLSEQTKAEYVEEEGQIASIRAQISAEEVAIKAAADEAQAAIESGGEPDLPSGEERQATIKRLREQETSVRKGRAAREVTATFAQSIAQESAVPQSPAQRFLQTFDYAGFLGKQRQRLKPKAKPALEVPLERSRAAESPFFVRRT